MCVVRARSALREAIDTLTADFESLTEKFDDVENDVAREKQSNRNYMQSQELYIRELNTRLKAVNEEVKQFVRRPKVH